MRNALRVRSARDSDMKIIRNTAEPGAESPFTVIHVSDTHLTLADGRDGKRKVKLSENRLSGFPDAEDQLAEISRLSSEYGAVIMHTGDLIDFVSRKNLEKAAEFTGANDCFVCAGNHEFSLYVGEAKEDEKYRSRSLSRVQRSFRNDIRFSSRVVSGVNFVAVDNSYYLFDAFQLEKLKAEVGKGLPVVLLLHTPLYNEEIYRFSMDILKNSCAYLMSVPEEKMKCYPQDRYVQQKENSITHEAYEYIMGEDRIKLLLTGHIHENFETYLAPGKLQLTTGLGTARIISIR